jgi:prepilin-type N-terminal cleavage/methylation domain-containing protein
VTPIQRRLRDSSGFTLVELLVVILIIGILAATGLAAFLMITWHLDHDSFIGATPDELTKLEPSLGAARGLGVVAGAVTFTVSVDSAAGTAGGGTFSIEQTATGDIVRDCTNPGEGGCAAAADARGNRW